MQIWLLWSNKTVILSNCIHVSTPVCLHYLDFDETFEKKEDKPYTRILYAVLKKNPGDRSLQNSSCTATWLPSHKSPTVDEKTCRALAKYKNE